MALLMKQNKYFELEIKEKENGYNSISLKYDLNNDFIKINGCEINTKDFLNLLEEIEKKQSINKIYKLETEIGD